MARGVGVDFKHQWRNKQNVQGFYIDDNLAVVVVIIVVDDDGFINFNVVVVNVFPVVDDVDIDIDDDDDDDDNDDRDSDDDIDDDGNDDDVDHDNDERFVSPHPGPRTLR